MPSLALCAILDIPLILDEIASSLSQSDLAQCLLVNSAWNAAFAPLVWKEIFIANQRIITLFQTSSAVQQGLGRNADHVRFIHSVFCYVFQSFPIDKPFRNLVRLDTLASELHNKGIVDHTNTQQLLRFVKVNTSLREIVLSNFPLGSIPTSRTLGDVLASHPSLVSVTINCFRDAELSSIQHVLRGAALANVEKLSLTCRSRIVWEDEEMQKVLLEASQPDAEPYQLVPQGHAASRLVDLTLDANVEQSIYVTLFPLLRHCPNLERLFVPSFDAEKSMMDLCSILQDCCPKVQHLEGGDHSANDDDQTMLLNACQYLKTYNMSSAQPMGLRSVEALLHHRHSVTLEKLSFRNCTAIQSRHIQLILTSCPNLRSFDGLNCQDTHHPRINIQDMPIHTGPAWVCKGLVELHIGFTGFTTLPENEAIQPYVDAIYRQLAVLTELESLYVGGEVSLIGVFPSYSRVWAFDFTLDSGLGQLATLQRLRTLNIRKLKHHRIGSEEAQWMVHHWPKLKDFYGPPEAPGTRNSSRGNNHIANTPSFGVDTGVGNQGGDRLSGRNEWRGYLQELVRYNPSLTITVAT
ncbi:MAG: hypothetical protein J3Q66DRAFT_330806 [Benniella sp.]|nr:MAG: hypothetical protein J3Q66DRAFT_330806 [Benniella sp.]